MAYLPEEKWSPARERLYSRAIDFANWLRNASVQNFTENREQIADKVEQIARCIKDFCFTIDEVARFPENDFAKQQKLLEDYIIRKTTATK